MVDPAEKTKLSAIGRSIGPIPTREDFARLAAVARAASAPWVGCRFFTLFATISLARLHYGEAINLAWRDLAGTGDDRSIEVARRASRWAGNLLSNVAVPPMLDEIYSRWEPRSRSQLIFPNQSRTARWEKNGVRSGARPFDQLREACDLAGTPPYTFPGLRRFADANASWLSDEKLSPFLLSPEDMRTKTAPMSRLREDVLGCYDQSIKVNTFPLSSCRMVFDSLATLKIRSTEQLTRQAVDLFAESVRFNGEGGRPKQLMNWFHAICNHAIRLGYLDEDPFVGIPGFTAKGWWRGGLRRKGEYSHPRRVISAPDGPPPIAANSCPVVMKEGFPILVNGKALPDMRGDAYKMLARLVEGFQQGRKVTASELAALSESKRLRPLTDALDRPGFEPLRRLIRETKEGRNKFLELRAAGPGG